MNKSMLVGAVLGAVGVTAGGAVATYSLVSAPQYAEVLAVKPVKETIKTPREVCKDVAVTRQAPVKDEHQIAGTAIGAVVGGLLGNLVGGAMMIEGRIARLAYISLYRMHQVALHGWFRTLVISVIGKINKIIRPRLKLH